MGTLVGDERTLERANGLALERRYDEAATEARKIDGRAASARAARLEAYTLLMRRDVAAARPLVVKALNEVPTDWELRRDWAVALAVTGRVDAAAAQMDRALALNPRMKLPFGFKRTSVRRP